MASRIENYIIFLILVFILIYDLPAQKYQLTGNDQPYLREYSQKVLLSKDAGLILANDKTKHFMASLISTVFIYQLSTKQFNLKNTESKVIAAGTTFSIGILKESGDKFIRKKKFSWKDLIANAAGIAVGLIIINQP